jgi:hypothetical protein
LGARSSSASRPSAVEFARPPAQQFVGRESELHELRGAFDEAASGRGSVVLITGEPGIGKTRLIQELGRLASKRKWRVLAGNCWEEGGAPAYWPWIQVVRAADGEFEQLATERPTDSGQGSIDPDSIRFRLFDAVGRFLEEAARRRPLLVALEDLHAADAASLLLLRFLGGSIAQSRILIVGSYRERESGAAERAGLLAELARVARRVPLRGLSIEEVGAYVSSSVGERAPPEVASKLHRITGGNPFFLSEVARLLVVDGLLEEPEDGIRDPMLRVPEEVRTLIRRRVAGLTPDAVAELRVAAAAGREFELRVLQCISPLSAARLLDVLTEAVHAGVLVEGGSRGRYAFVHGLVRETLYADLPPIRRLELHLAIGAALEGLAGPDLDPHLSEIAHHLALATPLGDAQKAVDYLLRAGDRSATLFAYEEAARHYDQGLELLNGAAETSAERRGRVLLQAADARWRAGDANAARQGFEQATEVARRLGDGEMLARAALGYVDALGGFLLFARFEAGATGVGLLREALLALPEVDSLLRTQLLARLAAELCAAQEPVEERLAVSEAAVEMARRLDDSEALVTALHARHWALTTPELVLDRLTHTEEMLRLARETANTETEFLAHNARFHCFLELCRGRSMDAEIEAMAAIAELIQQPFYSWHSVCLRTVRAMLDGRFADAERLAGEALEIGRLRQSEFPAYVFQFAQLFAIRWGQGRLDELWSHLREHGERFPWVPRWREALAAAELGDGRAAREEVERHAGRGFVDLPRNGLWTLHLCSLAEASVLIGDARRGEQLYELLRPHAEQNAVSYTQQPFGPVALRLGMLARLLGRWEQAERHFETALERCELLGAPAISVRVLYERALTLMMRGERGDELRAASLLESASRLCAELELPALDARVRSASRTELVGAAPEAIFRREGEFWTIAYGGDMVRLRDVKGLRYIAKLLAQPGRELHALELLQAIEGAPAARDVDLDAAHLHLAADSAVPVLDAKAKRAYRSRLQELGDDLQQARDWNDPERVARLEAEIDALAEQLARATGLGRRDRELPSPGERARVSVTKAIRAAIRAIDRHSHPLGSHLGASISTGRYCSYAPPGEAPPEWSL